MLGVRGPRPDGRAVALVGVAVLVALALDAVALAWTGATLLSTSHCGEDLAWVGLMAAGAIASVAAGVGILALVVWWSRGRPWAAQPWIGRMLVATIVAMPTFAGVAAATFPDGSC